MSKLVLFDFDGTLADTAPDLAASANKFRIERGLEPVPYERLRPFASQGARGMLRETLGLEPDHPDFPEYRERFLADYEQNMTAQTRLFPGIKELVDTLKEQGYLWGIVTNKVEYLAVPLVVHLGLYTDCAVVVGGDTCEHAKPHPAPMFYAAEKAGVDPSQAIYIGDDQRDVIAGKAAGMATIVAAYGYCGRDTAIHSWQADAIADSPEELWPAIQRWASSIPA